MEQKFQAGTLQNLDDLFEKVGKGPLTKSEKDALHAEFYANEDQYRKFYKLAYPGEDASQASANYLNKVRSYLAERLAS